MLVFSFDVQPYKTRVMAMKKLMMTMLLLVCSVYLGFAKVPNNKLNEQLLRYDYSQVLMRNDLLGISVMGNGSICTLIQSTKIRPIRIGIMWKGKAR